MKLILSRKGFDSSYGGFPSPILPDGRLISLPIPSKHDKTQFAHIDIDGVNVSDLVTHLTNNKFNGNSYVHLDPVLDKPNNCSFDSWLPSLGQTGAAQSHLLKQGVGKGDVFLFFGWFKHAQYELNKWRYIENLPDLHVLFGWLEVGEVLSVVSERDESLKKHLWAIEHPHFATPSHYTSNLNTLYVASRQSKYIKQHVGGGRFCSFSNDIQLTRAGMSRTHWSLPEWFFPENKSSLTYNPIHNWEKKDGKALLRSASIGQEFVLDVEEYPEAETWIRDIILPHGKP